MILNNNSFIIFIFTRSRFFISINDLCYKWLYLWSSLNVKWIFVLLDWSFTWFITTMYSSKIFLKLINIEIINELHFLFFTIRWWTIILIIRLSRILIPVFSFVLINHILYTLCEELFFLILIWVNMNHILIFIIIKWK